MSRLFGLALEFGEAPQLRGLTSLGALPPRSHPFLITPSQPSATRWMLDACQSIQHTLDDDQALPEWLVVDSYDEVQRRSREGFSQIGQKRCVYLYSPPTRGLQFATRAMLPENDVHAAMALLQQLLAMDEPERQSGHSHVTRSLQLARQRRQELLDTEHWLSAAEVHRQHGGEPDAKGQNNTASRLRKSRKLLGVWDGREFRHPAFQFRPDTGLLDGHMADLLGILPQDESGWRQAFWLFQQHAQLPGGVRPADVFHKDPGAVIHAATSDFKVQDEQW